ncbi:DNA helicase RecG, partial [Clostridiaceae bacterium UIB06]|nr:DNA helicase RecG [Clostridiaceae bacterium UIB06]
MSVYNSISSIKGVGPKTAESLEKCCIFNILDLLLYFPRDYEIIAACDSLAGKNNFGKVIIKCKVVRIERDIKTKTGKLLSTIVFDDGNNLFKGKWFNQPYIKNYFKINKEYTIMGKLQNFRGEICITNPALVKQIENVVTEEKVIPKYPLKSGVTNNLITK